MILRHLLLAVATPWIIAPVSASSYNRNPLTVIETIRDPSIDTSSHLVSAFQNFDLSFFAFKRRIRLALQPNHDILPEGARVNYLDHNGEIERTELIERHMHKVYHGDVWSQNVDGTFQNVGHARIMVHRDGKTPLFEGSFQINHDHHHIQLVDKHMRTRHDEDPIPAGLRDALNQMVIFRDSDISKDFINGHAEFRKRTNFEADRDVSPNGHACQSDALDFNIDMDHPVIAGMPFAESQSPLSDSPNHGLDKRQIDTSTGPGNSAGVNLVSSIGSTAGCPSTRRIALVGVATDCSYTASFANLNATRDNIITQINSASALYERTFQISLGLQNLTISPAECPGSATQATPWNIACGSADIQQRLNTFSTWRGRQQDNNAFWTLLTTCNTGPAVGLAWLGQSCVVSAEARNSTSGNIQTVSGANVVAKTSTEWQVIAHEAGHTFGAVHDCTSTTCNDGTVTRQMCCPLSGSSCDAGQQFIMNPSTARGITSFSQCSIGNICAAMGRGSVRTNCFSSNRGVPLITNAQCGNGIVEQGEDCDCGGTANCGNNACCDAATCRFKNNAQCDDSNEECCRSCRFAAASTVCRASTGVCDPEERCTGSSATCPTDTNAPDGQSCGNNGLQCASGHCTSRNEQCKTLMGSYGQGNDTYACDSSSCTLSCSSPTLGPNTCMTMNQNFLDGTQCGAGGRCTNGQCRGSSVGNEIRSWIDRHRNIVIGVSVAVGVILILAIGSCIWSSCKRKRRTQSAKVWPGTGRKSMANTSSRSNVGENWQPTQAPSSWRYG